MFGVGEGAPGLRHAVDPGLELGGDGEVVERCADHDHVGRQELAHQRLGKCVFLALRFSGGGLAGAETQRIGAQVRHHAGGQVQVLHLGARVGSDPGSHGLRGQLAGNGLVAGDGGIDVKQFHVGSPNGLRSGATATSGVE